MEKVEITHADEVGFHVYTRTIVLEDFTMIAELDNLSYPTPSEVKVGDTVFVLSELLSDSRVLNYASKSLQFAELEVDFYRKQITIFFKSFNCDRLEKLKLLKAELILAKVFLEENNISTLVTLQKKLKSDHSNGTDEFELEVDTVSMNEFEANVRGSDFASIWKGFGFKSVFI